MIFILIIAIAAFIAFMVWAIKEDIDCLFVDILGGLITSFLLCLALFLICSIFTSCINPETKTVRTESTEIYALKDTVGETYCARTCIDNELVYIYTYPTAQGITVGQIDADRTYIQPLPTGEMPTIVENIIAYKNPLATFFLLPPDNTYTLYVPDGTIANDIYSIDLE